MDCDSNNNNKILDVIKIARGHNKSANDAEITFDSLNLDTFLMILDHCDAQTLMNLCRINQEFRAKVCSYKHIFASKLFEVVDYDVIDPYFIEFGSFISKLDVCEYNIMETFPMKFNTLLNIIIGYSVPGNLTELTLRFNIVKVDKISLNDSLPYFSNLKHFKFDGQLSYSHAQERVLTEIIRNAQQLISLDIRYVRTAGKWFHFEHLHKLKRLDFLFNDLIKFTPFRQFIESRPQLQSLTLSIDSVHRQHLCKLVTNCIPNLEKFEIRNSLSHLPNGDDFDFSPYPKDYKRSLALIDTDDQDSEMNSSDVEDDDDEEEYKDTDDGYDEEDSDVTIDFYEVSSDESGDETDSDIDDVRHLKVNSNDSAELASKEIYNGLNRMEYLKRTWIKSHYSNWFDLYDTLSNMAVKNTVEYLTIQVNKDKNDFEPINFGLSTPFPQSFTNLKTLRIISPSNESQPCILHFIPALPNLTKFILDMDGIDPIIKETISNVIVSAKNLEILVLKMPAINFDHKLYMKLLEIQLGKSKELYHTKSLNIFINSIYQKMKIVRKLKENYNENIIAIHIKSFTDWETNPV